MTATKDLSPRVALLAWRSARELEAADSHPDACRCRQPSPMRYFRQSWCRLCGREIPPKPADGPRTHAGQRG